MKDYECKGLDEEGRCRLAIMMGATNYDWKCFKEQCKFYSQLTTKKAAEA